MEGVHKSRLPGKCQLELRTTALMELPSVPLPRPPFSLSCSFSTGLERVNLCTQPAAHVWSTAQKPLAAEDHAYSAEDQPHMEMEFSKRKPKICAKNLAALPASAVSCRTKGRSNSLPNMTHGPGDKRPEGKFSKNVLLQIFHGKILPGARRNKSSSSIFFDDRV